MRHWRKVDATFDEHVTILRMGYQVQGLSESQIAEQMAIFSRANSRPERFVSFYHLTSPCTKVEIAVFSQFRMTFAVKLILPSAIVKRIYPDAGSVSSLSFAAMFKFLTEWPLVVCVPGREDALVEILPGKLLAQLQETETDLDQLVETAKEKIFSCLFNLGKEIEGFSEINSEIKDYVTEQLKLFKDEQKIKPSLVMPFFHRPRSGAAAIGGQNPSEQKEDDAASSFAR